MTAPHVPEPTEFTASGEAGSAVIGRAARDSTERAADLLAWLGGASADITDRHERASYAVGSAGVLLVALACGTVVTLATAAAHWPVVVVVVAVLLMMLLLGAVGRVPATAPLPGARNGSRGRRNGELIGRIAVAALAGIVVAELASTVLLGATVDRRLDDRARRDAESAASVVTARTALDQAHADRGALDQTMTKAQSDIDQALIIARCEYNPTPQCPQDKITGVPGRGPETQTDNSMLDDARARLAAAAARVQPLDARAAREQLALDQARDTALRTGDRGLGARWLAMNGYSLGHAGALALRLATIVVAVALALLPLLLRWWREETAFDRGVSACAVADRAEQDAASAIAVRRAGTRAEAEMLRADQDLAAARLAVHADTAIDREQQRRRIIAAIGTVEIGITAPARRAVADFEALAELPAASPADSPSQSQEGTVPVSSNLPAPLSSAAVAQTGSRAVEPAKKGGGLELPIIGAVPFTDTAARWIRPLVPSFVTDAIDTATHPLRTVRQAFEETEEITFTLRRTRKVTVDSAESGGPGGRAGHQLPGGTVIDPEQPRDPRTALPEGASGDDYGLSAADRLAARTGPAELEYRGPQQLPPAPRTR